MNPQPNRLERGGGEGGDAGEGGGGRGRGRSRLSETWFVGIQDQGRDQLIEDEGDRNSGVGARDLGNQDQGRDQLVGKNSSRLRIIGKGPDPPHETSEADQIDDAGGATDAEWNAARLSETRVVGHDSEVDLVHVGNAAKAQGRDQLRLSETRLSGLRTTVLPPYHLTLNPGPGPWTLNPDP